MFELENIPYETFSAATEESINADSQSHQASKEFIATLPHVKACEEGSCCVCMDDIRFDEIITILPCTHKFHAPCVDGWLLIKPSCPICKTRIN